MEKQISKEIQGQKASCQTNKWKTSTNLGKLLNTEGGGKQSI